MKNEIFKWLKKQQNLQTFESAPWRHLVLRGVSSEQTIDQTLSINNYAKSKIITH